MTNRIYIVVTKPPSSTKGVTQHLQSAVPGDGEHYFHTDRDQTCCAAQPHPHSDLMTDGS